MANKYDVETLDYSKYFGIDEQGNKYILSVDHSKHDFWVETIIKEDPRGNYEVVSCNIHVPTEEERLIWYKYNPVE
jgi:hypothetical protein